MNMLTLKQYIAEQIERRLLNIEIFEMAISRKEFIRKFSGYAWQVAVNYVPNFLKSVKIYSC